MQESFFFDGLGSKAPKALQKDAEVLNLHENSPQLPREGGVSSTVATICQTPIFSAQMHRALGLDGAGVLETAATICRAKKSQFIATMKASMLEEGDLRDESLE